jgi:hypothetical protein
MDNMSLLGIAAGTLTTMSFLPQVLKTWRSKSVKDFFLLDVGGVFLGRAALDPLWIFDRLASDHRDEHCDAGAGGGSGRNENEVRLRGLGAVEVQAKLSSEKILFHFRLNLSLNLPSPGASFPPPQPDRHPF